MLRERRTPGPRGDGHDTIGNGTGKLALARTPMLIAQAVVERGMLDSIATRVGGVRYEIDARLGQGGTKYLLIGLGVLLVLWLIRRN